MHQAMTKSVLRSTILFFDSNPIGRIVTRFSKDMIVFDLVLPPLVILVVIGIFRAFSVMITVCVFNPYMLIGAFLCLILMVLVVKAGAQSMIEGQRLDSMSRGPIHNTFAMILNGLVTLRVHDRSSYFKQDFLN